MRSIAQFLLVRSGVLLGTAATLLIEFLRPRRAAEKAEAATDGSREIQETSLELLRETQLLLAHAQAELRQRPWWRRRPKGSRQYK